MCPNNPVETVSWGEAVTFWEKLNVKFKNILPKGMSIQLPTEAQWEYACHAGTTTRFYSGDADGNLDAVARYGANSDSNTHPVGETTLLSARRPMTHGA
jgi:formylglycine-generating enzyme required for sulfatase activity